MDRLVSPAPLRKLPRDEGLFIKDEFDYLLLSLMILEVGASVGKFAVQLAKLAKINVVIAVAGSQNKKELLDMGDAKSSSLEACLKMGWPQRFIALRRNAG